MSKRKIIYYLIALPILIAVILKIFIFEFQKEKGVVSFYNEIKAEGVPVQVEKIKKDRFYMFDRTTAIPLDKTTLESFVDLDLRNRIKTGQTFTASSNGDEFKGVIYSVDAERNLNVGLYRIILRLEGPINSDLKNKYYVKINTGVYEDAISIPIISLFKEGDDDFVWVVKEGNAVKRKIKVGDMNGERVLVSEGLMPEDMVVVKGMSSLEENRMVKISE